MTEATLWFDSILLDLITIGITRQPFTFRWPGRRSVKDLIESLGIPHVEVDLILANEKPVNFDYIVLDGDLLKVYGDRQGCDRSDCRGLQFRFPGTPRFVCDVHLGKLSRRLRLLGFDVDYRTQRGDEELARVSVDESRYLLTRDLQLLKRNVVKAGVFIRSQKVDLQLNQLCGRLELHRHFKPFSRCLSCNGALKPLSLDSIEKYPFREQIPERVKQWCRKYRVCTSCNKVYWPGTHYKRLLAWIQKMYPQKPGSQKNEPGDTKE